MPNYFLGIAFIKLIYEHCIIKRAKSYFKRAKTMLLLTIASLAFGGLLMTRMNEEKELYAPKGYMLSLQSRPRSVFSWY